MDIATTVKLKGRYNGKDLLDLVIEGKIPYLAREIFEVADRCECGEYSPKYCLVVLEHKSFLRYKPHIRFYCDKCKPNYL